MCKRGSNLWVVLLKKGEISTPFNCFLSSPSTNIHPPSGGLLLFGVSEKNKYIKNVSILSYL